MGNRQILKTDTSIRKSLAAFSLLAVFMIPSVLEFCHIFEDEDHVICHEKTEHMHEVASDCLVCHFHTASFSYELHAYPDLAHAVVPVAAVKQYTSQFQRFFPKTANSLRAPPQLLG